MEAIERRYQLLKINQDYITPVSTSFILALYELYEGKIRFIMDAVSNVIHELDAASPETIEEHTGYPILERIIKEKLELILTRKELTVLELAVELETFTNSQISTMTKIAPSNMSKYLKKLQELHHIKEINQEGREKYYQIIHDARLMKKNGKNAVVSKTLTSQEKRLQQAVDYLTKNKQFSCGEYQKYFNVSASTAARDLKILVQKGITAKKGRGRATLYVASVAYQK